MPTNSSPQDGLSATVTATLFGKVLPGIHFADERRGGCALSLGLYYGYARDGEVVQKFFPAENNAKMGFLEANYRF